jgi:hypothetical protein
MCIESNVCLFISTLSDDKDQVTDTNIPSHLELMLDILTQEESERESGETGPCMEYLLHHKILETLFTLGKADVRGTMPFSHYHANSNHTELALTFYFSSHCPFQQL